MATSGYISGTFSGKPTSQFYPYISWAITQSIVGNYSDVSMELHFVRVSSYYSYNLGGFPNTSNIDGNTNYTDTTNFDLRPSAGDYLIRTVTQRVYHNADGTKSPYLGWSGDCETSLGTFNFGATVAFDTIPREAYITNAVSFTVENNIPLTINNAGTLYVKALLYVNGTLIKTSNAGAVTSYTITPTSGENDAMYAQMPSSTSCSMYVRLQTFSDAGYSVQVGGNRDQTGTCSINQTTNKPTFTTFSIASVAKTVDNTDKYSNVLVSSALNTLTDSISKMIKGYTKARATVLVADKMVALNSATASKYRFANGSQYKDENYSAVADVTLDIDNCLVNSYTVTAYDSRNLTTTPSAQTFTNFAEYESTLLWGINLIRDNGVDTPVTLQISGSYWAEYFGGGTDGVENTITAHYRYKETTESWGAQSWESLTLDDTDGALSYDDYIEGDLGASGFDADKSYNVEVRIYDKLTNYILEGTINVGTPVLDMTKTGIALLGKYDDDIGGALQANEGEVEPVGIISLWGTTTAPTNWLICNGSAISRTTYARLFDVIGTTYGTGDGSTTFNLPNLQGKVPVGRNSGDTSFDSMGETGGAKTVTLTTTEMPSHNHGGATGGPNWSAPLDTAGWYNNVLPDRLRYDKNQGGVISTSHTHSISAQGGGGAHNNLQPYIVLNYIIKAV